MAKTRNAISKAPSDVLKGLGQGIWFRAEVRIKGQGKSLGTREKRKDLFNRPKAYLSSSLPASKPISKVSVGR